MSLRRGKLFERFIVLNNGRQMPMIGLGCYGITDRTIIDFALDTGYKHFDTASFQKNEAELGLEIHDYMFMNAYHRYDYFITSKIHPEDFGFKRATAAIDKSLEETQLGYIDNMLLQWPGAMNVDNKNPRNILERHEAWRALEVAIEEKKIAGAGVSNFKRRHLEKLLAHSNIKPTVDQIEIHPLYLNDEVYNFCKENDIHVQGYAPFAGGDERLIKNVTLNEIAKRNELTLHQLILVWHVQKGISVLPNSTAEARQKQNIMIEGLQIPQDDIDEIDSLRKTQGEFKKYWDSRDII